MNEYTLMITFRALNNTQATLFEGEVLEAAPDTMEQFPGMEWGTAVLVPGNHVTEARQYEAEWLANQADTEV